MSNTTTKTYDTNKLHDLGYGDIGNGQPYITLTAADVRHLADTCDGSIDEIATTISDLEMVAVDDINSAGIRAACEKEGIDQIALIGRYEHPEHPGSNDWAIRLYAISDWRVADTNGDPVWEVADPAEFATLLADYDISL